MIFSNPPRAALLQTLAICALAETVAATARTLDGAVLSVHDYLSRNTATELLPALASRLSCRCAVPLVSPFHRQCRSALRSRRADLLRSHRRARPTVTNQPHATSGSSLGAKNPRGGADGHMLLAERLKVPGLPSRRFP